VIDVNNELNQATRLGSVQRSPVRFEVMEWLKCFMDCGGALEVSVERNRLGIANGSPDGDAEGVS